MYENHDVLHYQRHGSNGPLVVMLHGLGSRGEDWVFQIEALREAYRIVTPDLRGHGDSPPASGWPTFEDLAADVVTLLRELGEPSAHFVGLSLGGGVALQLAVDHPEMVDSLTIVNAAATLRVPGNRLHHAFIRVALLMAGRRRRLGEWVAGGLFPREDQAEIREVATDRIAENIRHNYLRAVVAILRFNLRNRIRSIRAPTLVVAGEIDTTVPMSRKVELARSVPGARLEIISNSGHATPLDAPDEFNGLLLEFLAEQIRQPTP